MASLKIDKIEVQFGGVKPKNAPSSPKQQAVDELARLAQQYDNWQEQLNNPTDPNLDNPFADLEEDLIDEE